MPKSFNFTRRHFLSSTATAIGGAALAPQLQAHLTGPAMTWAEWTRHDAMGLAQLVRSGQVSTLEVAEQTMHAVHALNPTLNAVLEFYYDKIKETTKPLPSGVFQGAPYFFKDVGAVEKGRVMEYGTKANLGRIVTEDSEYIRRIRQSGLNFLGRCAAPEMGTSPVTESLLNGYSHNPWKLNHSPGGSSGGGAAAVAAGMLPMAASNDGGGSTRIPASLCGNVGLKHSRSIANVLEASSDPYSLVSAGVNSRSVRDTAAFLDAVLHPAQTNANPGKRGSYLAALKQRPKKLKIALSSGRWGPYQATPAAMKEMQRIAAMLRDLGHTVDEADADIAYDDFYQAFKVLWAAGPQARMSPEDWAKQDKPPAAADYSQTEPLTQMIFDDGKKWTWNDYQQAIAVNKTVTAAVDALLGDWDFWLTPTVASPAPAVGSNLALSYGHQSLESFWYNIFKFIPYTPLTNFTGHPSISLPLAGFEDGTPLGAHFIGANQSEANMLSLAAQLEEASPWFSKFPPTHVTQIKGV